MTLAGDHHRRRGPRSPKLDKAGFQGDPVVDARDIDRSRPSDVTRAFGADVDRRSEDSGAMKQAFAPGPGGTVVLVGSDRHGSSAAAAVTSRRGAEVLLVRGLPTVRDRLIDLYLGQASVGQVHKEIPLDDVEGAFDRMASGVLRWWWSVARSAPGDLRPSPRQGTWESGTASGSSATGGRSCHRSHDAPEPVAKQVGTGGDGHRVPYAHGDHVVNANPADGSRPDPDASR